MTVFLIVMTVLCVILLLPIRVKASFGDGKWSVGVYYTLLRVFHKESAPEPPPPQTPAIPDWVSVIRDVSSDFAYKNSQLAFAIPAE